MNVSGNNFIAFHLVRNLHIYDSSCCTELDYLLTNFADTTNEIRASR